MPSEEFNKRIQQLSEYVKDARKQTGSQRILSQVLQSSKQLSKVYLILYSMRKEKPINQRLLIKLLSFTHYQYAFTLLQQLESFGVIQKVGSKGSIKIIFKLDYLDEDTAKIAHKKAYPLEASKDE